ncbi:MAG TPA: MMPL family transporter [Flavobacterium sp.]|jgi:predicted RND superfamily exporter protein|nr:MMPL family transporter [Flavobacterium sp.]HQV35095.1 MMPL family transporter [Flavobacterium sp.]HQX03658.1 MMPL family transporter [Flavobacterium sp.]HRZ31254.1 MMPL family transporter [Flavobacterium sp.]HRZ74516.1 MMPL family transporter [Flavobacterium sp.]
MSKWFSVGFWESVARIILRNRITILSIIFLFTVFLALQWKNMRFTYTEANLLPDHHEINLQYNDFLDKFGEEGNLIVIGIKDSTFFTPKNFSAWTQLMETLKKSKEVELIISVDDLKKLNKNETLETFEFIDFINKSKSNDPDYLIARQKELFEELPFYEHLLINKKTGTIRSAIYLDKKIVNTSIRKDFIEKVLIPEVEKFEKTTKIDLKVSGMPYIRTLNSQNIVDEIGIFIGAALLVTSLIFFFFFRSYRATIISMCIVIVGVMWSFGTLGLLGFEITVLTAIIPPLIIVIGIPNCIFLINKYQQEIKNHGNQAKSLQRVISKVGNATLMTNLTTAAGFATFIITDSELLTEFGIVASINIVLLFILCLLVIPIIYSFMPLPKDKHLKHLNKTYTTSFVNWIEKTVKNNRISIYATSITLLVIGIIGIYQMRISGSLIEDMPKKTGFFKDIVFFEKEFDGIMPLEIMIDTKRKKGVMKLSTLKKMDEIQEVIIDIPELSSPMSVVNVVKYSKQAYYNGNPEYYELPTAQEQGFILSYAKNATKNKKENFMKSYVDSTGQYARITTFMKDIGTDKMEKIEEKLWDKINKVFPPEKYTVSLTGKALVFQKGTNYLVNNLVSSLIFAIFLISLFMAYLFRSFKMIIISLLPNLLPLIMTAGLMGYLGVPIKPSTILVFSIAFGISVDDTIHFLAKYRQELKANNWKIRKSVFNALRETGVSMFYTSIVLFFGFSVFMISSFGGTVALGGLISTTLLFAMFSNLILLPALLLSLEKTIANKEEFIEPTIDILVEEDEETELKS